MPRREAKHIRRELTDAQRARVAEARSLIQGEAAEIRRKAKEYKQEHDNSHDGDADPLCGGAGKETHDRAV